MIKFRRKEVLKNTNNIINSNVITNYTYSDVRIEYCIFHGIDLHYYQKSVDQLDAFRKILNFKKILTRKDLLIEEIYNDIIPKIYEQVMELLNDMANFETFFQYIRFNISFISSDKNFDKKDLKILYNWEIRGVVSL